MNGEKHFSARIRASQLTSSSPLPNMGFFTSTVTHKAAGDINMMKCVRNEHFSKSLHERAFSQLIPVAGTQIPEPDPVTFCVVATVTVTVTRHAVTESRSRRHGVTGSQTRHTETE